MKSFVKAKHASDCSLHNAPAKQRRRCDCGAATKRQLRQVNGLEHCRMCNGTGIVLVYPSKPYTGPPPFLLQSEMQCPDCKGGGF